MALHFMALESEGEEFAGEIVSATEVYKVDGLLDSGNLGSTFDLALAYAGMPQVGQSLSTSAPEVRVENRVVRYLGKNASGRIIRVDVTYRLQRPSAEASYLATRGGASLNQVTTQKDRDGNPIELTYRNETIRAELNVPVVQGHFSRELVESTDDPDDLVMSWVNHVNAATWHGGDTGQWLCTNVDYELVDKTASPRKYRFLYEFEFNPDYWTYSVAYKDADGNIPQDIIEGTGIKDIDWHPALNFSTKFA